MFWGAQGCLSLNSGNAKRGRLWGWPRLALPLPHVSSGPMLCPGHGRFLSGPRSRPRSGRKSAYRGASSGSELIKPCRSRCQCPVLRARCPANPLRLVALRTGHVPAPTRDFLRHLRSLSFLSDAICQLQPVVLVGGIIAHFVGTLCESGHCRRSKSPVACRCLEMWPYR